MVERLKGQQKPEFLWEKKAHSSNSDETEDNFVMTNTRQTLLGSLNVYGLPWPLFAGVFVIIFFTAYKGALTTDMTGTIALCIAIGAIFDEIGERLPIWNSYIGGGILMAFFGMAILKHFGIVPQKYLDSINVFISGDVGF